MKSPILALTFLAGLSLAAPASAGEVQLRADVGISAGRVTLGDLFEGAGAASRVVVAAAPGSSVVLDAGRVQVLARNNGLTWANPQGIRRIIARADSVGGGASTSAASAGAARGNREILAYARNIQAGEVVQPQDLIWSKAAGAPADAPSDADQVIGKAAKRPLREGAAAALRDLAAPQVIARDEVVSISYQSGGITLTLQAKATSAAGIGETFNAINPASKKIIQAVAIAPGQGVVGPEAQQARAGVFQIASR